MISPWERIPKELLEAILDKIEEDDFFVTRIRKHCLFQLMLTCKHWSSIAKEAFYNEQFTLDMNTAKKLVTGKAAQQLSLKDIEVTYELANDATFVKLLSMCPDLTNLRVQTPSSNVELPSPRKSFYTSLYVLSRSKHLAKLRKVEFELQQAQADQLLVHHQQAMRQLRHSLTSLYIVDSTRAIREHNYIQPPKQFIEWFDQLKDFPRLNTVKVGVSSLTYLYEMDRFIQKIGPTVSNISITMRNNRILQPLKNIHPATIVRHHAPIETLKIEMALLRIEDIKYITHKFERLSNLQLAVWGVAYNEDPAMETLDLSATKSADSLAHFFEHLTKLSEFLITKIRLSNRHLRQTLTDLKKWFRVKHLTISNIIPTSDTSIFSIKCLSRAKDGHRGHVYLDLEIGTAQLLSIAKLVYDVLNEDVLELQFGNGLIEHYDDYDDRNPCYVQGKAVELGINLLPLLKTLTAINPGIDSMKSIVNPKAPKLSLDMLELGNFTDLPALFQMSQRIKYIKRWVAPYLVDFDVHMERQNYVLNMPFTTFDEIDIDSECVSRFIVKLCTSSNTTFHGVGLSRDNQLPTEDDYYEEDDDYPEEYDYEESLDVIGKVTIVCADVKTLKVAFKSIKIEN